jgi:uncharacterized protein (DUF486 family)
VERWMNPYIASISLLFFSSAVMVVAWYAHLKFTHAPLWFVILASWGLAFFEYTLQVPANRIGHQVMSAAQLRIIAEVFTLIVFFIFSTYYLKEKFTLNYLVSFIFIFLAVFFAFLGPFKE